MKNYTYPIIDGVSIDIDELRLPLAVAAAFTVQFTERVTEILCRRNANGDEILLLTLDLQIPSEAKNGILEQEDVAIVFQNKEDYNNFPIAYALRENFRTGLPHEIITEEEHPVMLCLYEHRFADDLMRFNPEDYLLHLFNWLEKTACDVLHASDQMLESYYNVRQLVYANFTDINNNFTFGIRPILKKEPYTFNEIVTANKTDKKYVLFVYKCEAKTALVINKVPKCIADLPTSKNFCYEFLQWANKVCRKNEDRYCGIICLIPKKRHNDEKCEQWEAFLFTTQKSLWHICRENNQWDKKRKGGAEKLLSVGVDTFYCTPPINRDQLEMYSGIKKSIDNCSLIGVGSLGSQILDDMARSAMAKQIEIFDNDVFMPHNTARHVLEPCATYQNKTEALANKYNTIGASVVVPYAIDFLCIKENDANYNALAQANLIIDCSTSIAVERKLALDFPCIKGRRVSVFFNIKGDDLVLLVEDKNRKYTLDLLEMTYYRKILTNNRLSTHFDTNAEIQYSNLSCRSKSFVISGARVKMLSSIASLFIQNTLNETDAASVNLWHLNADGTVNKVISECSEWSLYTRKDGIYKIYVNKELQTEMKAIRTEKLESKNPTETGGVLLGTFDTIHHIIYVVAHIPAPNDSVEQPDGFIRGCKGLEDEVKKASARCAGQITYIGEDRKSVV